MAQVLGPSPQNAAALRAMARAGDDLGYTWASVDEARRGAMLDAAALERGKRHSNKWAKRIISVMGMIAGVPPGLSGALSTLGFIDNEMRSKAYAALRDHAARDPFSALDVLAQGRHTQERRQRSEMQAIREAK